MLSRRTQHSLRRRPGRRAVSPIIATVLLVAITVVLAGLLYVFLVPLLGSSTTPLDGNFAWGTATTQVGNPSTADWCHTGNFCWKLTLSTAGSGVSASALQLYIQNSSQVTSSNSSWTFTFVDGANAVVARAPGPVAGGSTPWVPGSGYTTTSALTLAMSLWVDTGSAHPLSNQGSTIYAVGQSGFSGTVQQSLP